MKRNQQSCHQGNNSWVDPPQGSTGLPSDNSDDKDNDDEDTKESRDEDNQPEDPEHEQGDW